MIMDNSLRTSEYGKIAHVRICWSAILAGALVGIGLAFLLNLFAVAIGLSAYKAAPDGSNAIAIGGVLGILIGIIATMGTAGLVAGYLGRFNHNHCHGGAIYGFITWTLALVLSAILIIPFVNYSSHYEKNLSPTVTNVDINPATTTVSEQPKENVTPVTVQTKHLVWSGWILFVSFFIGAFSSCVGACYGMRCRHECTMVDETTTTTTTTL
ncbi:MAG: hypothetical protein P4L65_02835 [Legionella sp.]|nr:hypothetical protein [Legionella sp.]